MKSPKASPSRKQRNECEFTHYDLSVAASCTQKDALATMTFYSKGNTKVGTAKFWPEAAPASLPFSQGGTFIDLHFRISQLSQIVSIAESTRKKTINWEPTGNGKFYVSVS